MPYDDDTGEYLSRYDGNFYSYQEELAFYSLPVVLQQDSMVDALHHVIFDPNVTGDLRANAFQSLSDILESEYGLDIEDVFDFEDFRDWYDRAA